MRRLWVVLVRFGFRLLYNELAFTYDIVSRAVSLGAWRCWQRAALRHLKAEPGALLLELGHGTGDLQIDLNALGYCVVGHDLSGSMSRIARGKLRRMNMPTRLTRGRAECLPYPSGIFAAVISTFPTSYILEPETLQEIHRVLGPAGPLLIVPNGAFTTRGSAEIGLEWLYRVTGQRNDTGFDIENYFSKYGFDARVRQEPCPRSMATVIVAQKKSLWHLDKAML